ncbi:MAG TPA: YlxR family protein [Candidatus Limnocylindrales bacterium]|nr:YlxR family protein [Candidatus Limnocylindrales bacterium]
MTSMAGSAQPGKPAPVRRFPVRTCVACRTERQKREFVRIVRAPDGEISLDLSGRAHGRGAYLCADGSCWTVAIKKKSLERALSAPLPPELRAQLAAGPTTTNASHGGGTHGPQ